MRLHSNPIFEQIGKNYKTLTVGHSRNADILTLPLVLEALEWKGLDYPRGPDIARVPRTHPEQSSPTSQPQLIQ